MYGFIAAALTVLASAPSLVSQDSNSEESPRDRAYERALRDAVGLPRGKITVQVAEPEGNVRNAAEVVYLHTTAKCEETYVYYMADIREPSSMHCGTGAHYVESLFQRVRRGGRFVFEATFDEAPYLDYRIFALSDRLLENRVQRVRPGEIVRFVYQREDPERASGFRVRDAVSGRSIERYWVWPPHVAYGPKIPGDSPLSVEPAAGGVHSYQVSPEDAFEWVLHVPGYQRAYGDQAAFEAAEAPDRGRWAEVDLSPGFGIRVRAQDAAGRPLSDVKIRFEGTMSLTDDSGEAYLATSAVEPKRSIDVIGYEVVGGNVGTNGTFEARQGELRVVLERSP